MSVCQACHLDTDTSQPNGAFLSNPTLPTCTSGNSLHIGIMWLSAQPREDHTDFSWVQ